MAGPGGPIVGRVRLKVSPDVSGFRREVEQQMNGLRDAEVNVTPDMDGFRQKVNSATKGLKAQVGVKLNTAGIRDRAKAAAKVASGTTVDFDTALRSVQLAKQVKKATRELSGSKIRFQSVLVTRFTNPEFRFQDGLPGLKQDLKDIGTYARRVTLGKFLDDALTSEKTINRIQKGSRAVVRGFSKGSTAAFQGIGQIAREAGDNIKMYSQLVRAVPQVELGERKLRQGLGEIRRKVIEARAAITEFQMAGKGGSPVLMNRAKESNEAIKSEIAGLKKLKAAQQVFNRRGKRYNAELHNQYQLLVAEADKLSAANPFEGGKRLAKVSSQLAEVRKGLGDTADESEVFAQRLADATKTYDQLTRRAGMRDKYIRLTAPRDALVETEGYKKVIETSRKVRETVVETNRRIRESYKKSRVPQVLSEIGFNARLAAFQLKEMGSAFNEQGITGPATKLNESTKGIQQRFRQINNTIRNLPGNMANASRSVQSFGARSLDTLTHGFRRIPDEAGKAGTSSFKKFWSKFHQPGQKKFGMTEGGWLTTAIVSLIAPLSGIIGGALAALPALGLAAAAALGATVLGWEGIKEAASAAAPAVEDAKSVLSATFQDRLTPQFSKLGEGLRAITPDLDKLANGMSDFSQGFVDSMTSTKGIGNIKELLGNTSTLFSDLKPFARDFTDGLLEMAAAGSRSFEHLGEGLNRFGSDFKQTMTEMSADGTLQAAIESTFDVLGSLGNNLGKVMRAGMQELPDIATAFNGALDSLGDGLVDLMPLFSTLSQGVLGGLENVFDEIAKVGTAITPAFQGVMDSIGPGGAELVSGIGDLASQIAPAVGAFVEGIAPLAGDLASGIGTALSGLAEVLNQYAPEIQSAMSNLGETLAELPSALMGDIEMRPDPNAADYTGVAGFFEFFKDQYLADIHKVRGDIQNFVQGENASIEVTPNLKINPEVDMGGAITALQGSVTGPIADLEVAIQQFKVNAEQIASEAEIDISPQIKILESATDLGEFSAATQTILDTLQASTAPGDLELEVDPDVRLANEAAGITDGVRDQVTTAMEGLGPELSGAVEEQLSGALSEMDASVATAAQGIGTSLGEALGGIEVPTEGLTSSIMTAFDGLNAEITAKVSEIGTTAGTAMSTMFSGVTVDMAPVGTAISSGLDTAISTAMSQAASTASTAAQQITTSAVEGLGDMPSQFGTKGTEAGTSLATGISGQQGAVSAAASSLKTAATGALSGIDMSASGAAVGSTFAAGIRSQIGSVAAAASELAAAARAHFPNSPAKKGPFSGAGWIDKSGIAVGKTFAESMESQVGVVEKAATAVTGAAQKKFDEFSINPAKSLEAFQRDQILQPVLEGNAKKIASWRERDAQMVEQHHERMADSAKKSQEQIAKINERDGKEANKAKSIASQRENQTKRSIEAEEKLAERRAEAREKMLESLDRPYYEDIDRSFNSYYVEGMKKVLSEGLKDVVSETDLAGQIRDVANHAVREGRKAFGNNHLFDLAEFNVNSDHFADALQRAIDEAGIAEVPVNFAVSNVDQLMSDLELGDGVISRVIDQARSVDPAATDARYARQNPVEVHYHVQDMEEAIRLEQERERKAMMRIK